MQAGKPVRGKRKAPEPTEGDDSEDADLSSEDEPLPGEEDPEDSNDSDEDILEHDDAEEPADELTDGGDSDDDARVTGEDPHKADGGVNASTRHIQMKQQVVDATDEGEDDSDDDLDEGDYLRTARACLLCAFWLAERGLS